MIRWFSVLFIFLVANISLAAEIFVDPSSGSDSASGSQSQPLKSIDRAIDVVKNGDSITLLPGSYPALDLRSYVGPATPLKIQGVSSDSVVLTSVLIYNAGEKLSTNIHFSNIHIADGVTVRNAADITFSDSKFTMSRPLVGSEEAIGRAAIFVRDVRNVTIKGNLITEAPVGLTAYDSDDIFILDNVIRDLSHDGIRFVGVHNGEIRRNTIYGLTDGVSDDEASWSKHCDAMHFFIGGAPKEKIRPNDGIIVDSNFMSDVQGQIIQFNNYGGYDEPELWNKNFVFTNNVIGPSTSPASFNDAEPVLNLYVYNNTFTGGESVYTSPYEEIKNKVMVSSSNGFRVTGATQNLHIFNNYFNEVPNVSLETVKFYDYNYIRSASGTYSLPRNNVIYNSKDIYFNSATDWSVAISENSQLVDAGVIIDSINNSSTDINGKSRQYSPDIGAYEYGDKSSTKNVLSLEAIRHDDQFVLIKDDFEDANFNADYALTKAGESVGAQWELYEGSGPDFRIEHSNHSSHVSNFLGSRANATGLSIIFLETPEELKNYVAKFTLVNLGVNSGSGILLQFEDSKNYTYIDFGGESGRVISVENGSLKVLAHEEFMKLPDTEPVDVSLTLKDFSIKAPSRVTIKIGGDSLTVDLPELTNMFGLIHDSPDLYYRLLLDDLEVQPLPRPNPPSIL